MILIVLMLVSLFLIVLYGLFVSDYHVSLGRKFMFLFAILVFCGALAYALGCVLVSSSYAENCTPENVREEIATIRSLTTALSNPDISGEETLTQEKIDFWEDMLDDLEGANSTLRYCKENYYLMVASPEMNPIGRGFVKVTLDTEENKALYSESLETIDQFIQSTGKE